MRRASGPPLPTTRLLALALLTVLFFAVVAAAPPLLIVAVACGGVALGLSVLDLLRSPHPRLLTLTRTVEERLSLGDTNTVTLHLHNPTRYPLLATVRDEVPEEFTVLTVEGAPGADDIGTRTPLARVSIPALGVATLSYTVRPPRRGLYHFGAVTLRYPTLFGLWQRQWSYPLTRAVKVYPNLRAVRRYDLALRRGRLDQVGVRPIRQIGAGTAFERLRDYRPDDDYRRINWAATARRHAPVTADYGVERARPILLLLDVGRLMNASIEPLTRLDHAVNSCLLCAYVCLARGDNVGLLAFADRVTLDLPPRGGKRQFHLMLDALYNVAAQPVESDYRVALAQAQQRLRQRTLVLVFTEIVDTDASRALVGVLTRLAQRHAVVTATLRDPAIESMLALTPRSTVEVYRRAVALNLLERRRATLEVLHTHGVLTIDVPADRLSPEVINTYLDLKSRGRV